MKRLVVCCDGTWNRPTHVDRGVAAPTNVAKFALGLAERDADGHEQRLHYEAGVGTRRHERLVGGAFGVGLSRNVRDGYRFLVDNYEPGDALYLLGFSRGAYTARSLAGLIRNCGILRAEHVDRIKDAYILYRSPQRDTEPSGLAAELFRHEYSHPLEPIEFVGVWDTVGALGIPIGGFQLPLLSRLWRFHDTDLSRYIRNAHHAVSIDERRRPFKPTLWTRRDDAEGQKLEQVWFTGVHCDVGGGYRDPSLSEIPLLWMVQKAAACGLAFQPDCFDAWQDGSTPEQRHRGAVIAPSPRGPMGNSLKGIYLLWPYNRRLAGDGGAAVDGGALASSAKTRHDEDPAYRPRGLAEWLAARKPVETVTEKLERVAR